MKLWFNPVSRTVTTPTVTTPAATVVTPLCVSTCHVPRHPGDTKGTPLRSLGTRPRTFQGLGHSKSLASIHLPLDLNGKPTDGPLMLLQAEHLGFCRCRVFLLKGVCVVCRQLWPIGQAPSHWKVSTALLFIPHPKWHEKLQPKETIDTHRSPQSKVN